MDDYEDRPAMSYEDRKAMYQALQKELKMAKQELAELKSLMAGWYKLLHQLDLTPEEVQLLHSKDAQLKQACTLANDSKEVE